MDSVKIPEKENEPIPVPVPIENIMDGEEEDEEAKYDGFEGFNGSGRTITLQMLLAANVLLPGKSTMTIEYLGQKFVGDLLADGKIKSHETETIFLSPSAWAMHCKRIINPDKKSGCGWASVKYKGKKLDAYKAIWLRKYAQQKDPSEDDNENDFDKKPELEAIQTIQRIVIPHNTIANRNQLHDANTLIEIITFANLNKMQPFFITITSNALLLADFHCHLTLQEVCGYYGGTWDVNTHTLVITKAYPCKNTKYDREKAPEVEADIQKALIRDQLILVGWYHSHPKFQALPTLRDCDSQLDYQIKMRGPSDITYTPCIGFIFSPYYDDVEDYQSSITPFWVIPPSENRQILEYGRPVLMQYDVVASLEVDDPVRIEMQQCVAYYSKFRNELIDFSIFYNKGIKYIDKLLFALYSKFPDNQNDLEFWNWMCQLLKCEPLVDFESPPIQKAFAVKSVKNKVDDNIKEELKKDVNIELKVLSLQEQLSLPSGLNMNPSKLIPPITTNNSPFTMTSSNATSVSPNESPITVPSESASPVKVETPIRSSPSPAKSESSTRTRNSPISNKFLYDLTTSSPKNKSNISPSPNPELFSQLFLPSDLTMTLQDKDTFNQFADTLRNEPSKSKNSDEKEAKALKATIKEFDDLRNDPLKISEIIRSPEYAQILLSQAELLGATALSSMGLPVTDLFASNRFNTKSNSFNYNDLLNNKVFGFDTGSKQSGNKKEFSSSNKSKNTKSQLPPIPSDYAAVLQQYSKLFDSANISQNSHVELANLLNMSTMDNKKKDNAFTNNMLSNILKSEKDSTELNNMLFLNTKSSTKTSSPATSDGSNKSQDNQSLFPKDAGGIDYSSLFQQAHGKFNMPDPLSKSTLAANNMFMTPSALLKMHQQESSVAAAAAAMMMKPPKSSPSPTNKIRENTISNILGGNSSDSNKIDDLSQQTGLAVDLTRIYNDLPKKRMEFSSIADLVAPPPAKITKSHSQDDILNLSAKD